MCRNLPPAQLLEKSPNGHSSYGSLFANGLRNSRWHYGSCLLRFNIVMFITTFVAIQVCRAQNVDQGVQFELIFPPEPTTAAESAGRPPSRLPQVRGQRTPNGSPANRAPTRTTTGYAGQGNMNGRRNAPIQAPRVVPTSSTPALPPGVRRPTGDIGFYSARPVATEAGTTTATHTTSPVSSAPAAATTSPPVPLSGEDCEDRAVVLRRQYALDHTVLRPDALRQRQVFQINLANNSALALHRIVDSVSPEDRRILRAQLRGLNPAPRIAFDILNSLSQRMAPQINSFECDRFIDPENHWTRFTAHDNPRCTASGTDRLRPGVLDFRNRTVVRLVNGLQRDLDEEDRNFTSALEEITEDRVRTRYQQVMAMAYSAVDNQSGTEFVTSAGPARPRQNMNSSIPEICADSDRTLLPTSLSAQSIIDAVHLRGNLVEGNVSCKFDKMIRLTLGHEVPLLSNGATFYQPFHIVLSQYLDELRTDLQSRGVRGKFPPEQFTDADGELLTQIRNLIPNPNQGRTDRSINALRERRNLYRRFFLFLDRQNVQYPESVREGLNNFRNVITAWYVLDQPDETNNLAAQVTYERELLTRRHQERRNQILMSAANINGSYFEVCSHRYESARQRGDVVVCGQTHIQDLVAGTYPNTRTLYSNAASTTQEVSQDAFVTQGLRDAGCPAVATPIFPRIRMPAADGTGTSAH